MMVTGLERQKLFAVFLLNSTSDFLVWDANTSAVQLKQIIRNYAKQLGLWKYNMKVLQDPNHTV